ncbi:MAG: hypothetical protein Q9167_006511 [Letrouitia subvulpina]
MFSKPEVEHIKTLHIIGLQLGALKRIYQSYVLIIERILDRQKPLKGRGSPYLNQNSIHAEQEQDSFCVAAEDMVSSTQTFEVPMSSTATVRFERLRDRINLYAISEIQECLDEKESLVFLNFNLITLKESHAVERLTRITILLAKVTILFMPVSLMTGYFSVQITDLQGVYTAKTYWVCFAIIMTLSMGFLIVFGQLSGTVEGRPIYRSLTETFYDFSKRTIGSRRQKGHIS